MGGLLGPGSASGPGLPALLDAGEIVLAPGCYDALGARLIEGGKTLPVSYERLRELGFNLVIFPLSVLLTATTAIRSILARIKADGTPIGALPSMLGFEEFLDFIGMPEVRDLEQRFS